MRLYRRGNLTTKNAYGETFRNSDDVIEHIRHMCRFLRDRGESLKIGNGFAVHTQSKIVWKWFK